MLDPETLLPVAPPLRLPEPSIARLAGDGETVIAVGTTMVFRLRLDRQAGRLVIDDRWRPSYGPAPGRSFGWDPVITDEHVLWMDNGRNRVDRSMVGSGVQSDPVRLWWARHDDGSVRSTEISGLPFGTESNPPGWDPGRRIVVAYDAGNAVVRAWRMNGDELEPLWRRDGLAHAGHLILYPDTRELIVGTGETSKRCADHSSDRPFGPPVSFSRDRRRPAEPPCDSAATSSWCSTSTRARRRRASTSPPPRRDSSSPPPASAVTSTTNR